MRNSITKFFAISFFFVLSSINVLGCLNTYQSKIFPVGIYKDKIISIDVQIRRTSEYSGSKWLGLNTKEPDKMTEMWILHTFMVTYNEDQTVKSLIPLDTVYSIGNSYTEILLKAYQTGYNKILKDYPSIELFTPAYISFCGFQKHCKLLEVHYDSIQKTDFLLYNSKKYSFNIIQDKTNYPFKGYLDHEVNTTNMYLSSIRKYSTKTMTLVLAHLETGHETVMEYVTTNPNKIADGEPYMLANEHKPKFEFKNMKTAVYKEPLMHHGYGYDVFVIEK